MGFKKRETEGMIVHDLNLENAVYLASTCTRKHDIIKQDMTVL